MFRAFSLAAALALAALPAAGEGQIRLSIKTAPGAPEAEWLRLVLGAYALHRDIKDNGQTSQQGRDHVARLFQSGQGNFGLIEQRGAGHRGDLRQTGNDNAHALFQSGKSSRAHIRQRGDGGTGVTIVHGF